VRVDLKMTDGSATWVQLSRGAAVELGLSPGEQVWISPTGSAATGQEPREPLATGVPGS
jgi:hypothetical protein